MDPVLEHINFGVHMYIFRSKKGAGTYIRMHKVHTYNVYKQTYTHTDYTLTEYLICLVGGLGPHEGHVGFLRSTL